MPIVDHRDGNTLRNVLTNLRLVNHSQNAANSRRYKNSKSPYRGITFKRGRWVAQIHIGGGHGSVRTLGPFDTAEEAARAFDEAIYELHGEHARLNFPRELKTGLPLFDLARATA
jgi:hypothetical protein